MKTIQVIIVLSFISVSLFAQKKTAESSEIYTPVPPIVTPGEGTNPPSDALVLFNGSNLDQWESEKGGPIGWTLADGYMTVKPGTGSIKTKKGFGDCQLHIEWLCPFDEPVAEHGFGNSGIKFQGRYELQIFESYKYPVYHNGKPIYTNGQAGSIYKQLIPLVNVCKKPGEWQAFDVIFIAPRFSDNGRVAVPARITVIHNGVLIINNFEIQGTTMYIGIPEYEKHSLKEPLLLQEHSDPVSFRNIWIREL